MGWINKIAPKPVHICKRPNVVPSEALPGSIWQCDECNRQWKIIRYEVDWHNEYAIWEMVRSEVLA